MDKEKFLSNDSSLRFVLKLCAPSRGFHHLPTVLFDHGSKCHILEILDNIATIQPALCRYDFLMDHENFALWAVPEKNYPLRV